jgi:hypothetical protein
MSGRLRAPRMKWGSPNRIDARNTGADIFHGLIDRSFYDHEGPGWSEMGAFPALNPGYSRQLRSVLSFAFPFAIVCHCILNGASAPPH